MMFPEKLDGADVLFYTEKGDYGTVNDTNGKICDYVSYFAVCSYSSDKNKYYLFLCDECFDVITDWFCDSVEECMQIASNHSREIVWHKY